MGEADEAGGEGEAHFEFPGLDGGGAEDGEACVFLPDAGGGEVFDVEGARDGIAGKEVEGKSKAVFVTREGVPFHLDGDAEVADVGVGVLLGGGGGLEELEPHVGEVVPRAGGFDIVEEPVPREVVAEACGELPVGRELPVRHNGQLDGGAVIGIVGGMIVAVVVEGDSSRGADIDFEF